MVAMSRASLRWVLSLLVVGLLGLSTVAVLSQRASAEGSRDASPKAAGCPLASTGSCRLALEWRGGHGGSTLRRTLFTVFARTGEVLDLGSSAVGTGSADVVVWNPGQVSDDQAATLPTVEPGSNGFSCAAQRSDLGSTTAGQITTRAQELAGPQAVSGGGNPDGYVPCHYTAPATGLYKVAFYGPAGPDGTGGAGGTGVAAWDITVRADDTSTTDIPGRVLSYALAASTGGSGALRQALYATTDDGYVFRLDTHGLHAHHLVLRGSRPGHPHARVALSYYRLSPSTLHALHVGTTPPAPVLSDLQLHGDPGGTVQVGHGGRFTFHQNVPGTYSIVISRDGTDFDPTAPGNRLLHGVADAGSHTVVWDGEDNAGNPFPAGAGYTVHADLRTATTHFPLLGARSLTRSGPGVTLVKPHQGPSTLTTSMRTVHHDVLVVRTSVVAPTQQLSLDVVRAPAADVAAAGDDSGVTGTAAGQPVTARAFDDAESTSVNEPVVADAAHGLLGNDHGAGLTLSGHTDPRHGTLVSIRAGGGFRYQPQHNFSGTDRFRYTVVDSAGHADTATVALQVGISAVDDAASTPLDTPVTVSPLTNDVGTGLHLVSLGSPPVGEGTVTRDGDDVMFAPATGFSGVVHLDYSAQDDQGQVVPAHITITVEPRATTDSGATTVGQPLAVTAAHGLLHNDGGTGLTVSDHTDPAHGSAHVDPDGAYTYTPQAGFSGTDAFDYTLTDAAGTLGTATVHLTVSPVAVDDLASTTANHTVTLSPLGNDRGTGLQVSSLTQPRGGVAAVLAAGRSLRLAPAHDYSGVVRFSYTVRDASGLRAEAVATVTVLPTAASDRTTTLAGIPVILHAPVNDHGTRLRVVSVQQPPADHGVVDVEDNALEFFPAHGFTGTAHFAYTVRDLAQHLDTATATVTVRADPQARPDHASTSARTPVVLHPLANDPGSARFDATTVWLRDPRSGMRSRGLRVPGQGVFAVDPTLGRVLFVPQAGFTGATVPVTYQVLDRGGRLHASTLRVAVISAGYAPGYAGGHTTGGHTTGGLRPGSVTVSTGLKPGAVVNGRATSGSGGPADSALPDTGAPMSPVMPLTGLLLVVAGFVLVRRPTRRPAPRHRAG